MAGDSRHHIQIVGCFVSLLAIPKLEWLHCWSCVRMKGSRVVRLDRWGAARRLASSGRVRDPEALPLSSHDPHASYRLSEGSGIAKFAPAEVAMDGGGEAVVHANAV